MSEKKPKKGKVGMFFIIVPEKVEEAVHAVLDRMYELSPEAVEKWFKEKETKKV